MFKNVKILTWLVIVLLATNVATIISVVYHVNQEATVAENVSSTEVPGEQRTRFFKEQLGLSMEQLDLFRESNRKFNRKARTITDELDVLRKSMVNEMVLENSDSEKLDLIAKEIGEQHEQLKIATFGFYLELKEICDSTQKEKLAGIFQSLLNSDEKINLPQRQRRFKNRQ